MWWISAMKSCVVEIKTVYGKKFCVRFVRVSWIYNIYLSAIFFRISSLSACVRILLATGCIYAPKKRVYNINSYMYVGSKTHTKGNITSILRQKPNRIWSECWWALLNEFVYSTSDTSDVYYLLLLSIAYDLFFWVWRSSLSYVETVIKSNLTEVTKWERVELMTLSWYLS